MLEKHISIVVAASGEIKDLAISQGATVKEILNEAGLEGYQLSRKGGEPLDPNTDIYDAASDLEKLYATPEDVSVGNGGSAPVSRLSNFLEKINNIDLYRNMCNPDAHKRGWMYFLKRKNVRLIGVRHFDVSTELKRVRVKRKRNYIRTTTKTISRNKEYPYWQENGWKRLGRMYRGYYTTDYGTWNGLIEENYRGSYSFHIFNPPEVLKNSFHWSCFSNKGNGKYSIHFSRKPRDVSSGIIKVEQIIRESFKKEKGGKPCFLGTGSLKEYILNRLGMI